MGRHASPLRDLPAWTFILGCLNIAGFRTTLVVRAEVAEAVKVPVVVGGDAVLPCETRSKPPDALLLVVWYKENTPIYSYDGRSKLALSAHWADDTLTGRARWLPASPSALRIRDVIPSDRAIYRCRVDYKITPTKNYKIILDVIELPEKPKIFDEHDKEVIGIAGPYIEDTSLKLTCVVSGGKPMPRLRWWRDDKVISQLQPMDDDTRLSILELRIPKLNRQYLEAVFTCAADNTLMVPPLKASVQIQLYLRPLLVEIMPREQPLTVGQKAELSCRAVGARPPAVITWWLDDQQLPAYEDQKNSKDQNETVSKLRWIPLMEQNGHVIICRATHIYLKNTVIESSLSLKLHYMPIVTLQLGSNMNPNDIEEGDDVYFECIVRSHPPSYKVVWEHNGQVMTHNQRAGVIAGSANLALQGVSKEQAGKYVCTASNVEGDGKSTPVNLQIIYKPECTNSMTAIVGAALHETAKVTCEVDAFPPAKNFQWTLNNSMGTLELEPGKFTVDPNGRSILSYTPMVEGDYGSLSCKATNLAGQQVEPCRYTLLPAVRPDPPYNCTSLNLSEDSVELRCAPGYDGGLHTTYFVEVWESKLLLANVSTPTPVWKLRGLGPEKALKVLFYANNARGRSETTSLKIHTFSRVALKTEVKTAINLMIDVSWALSIIAGLIGTFTIVVIVVILAKKRRRSLLDYEAPMQMMKTYKNNTHSDNPSPMQPDDTNPDVIPLGKDFNCTRDLERPPEPPPYGAMVSSVVGASKSAHSLHQHEIRAAAPHTPNTPASDTQSIGALLDDRRSVTSGTLSRRREVVTTRTPLLANARESCV